MNNLQKWFNKAYLGVMKQGKLSYSFDAYNDVECRYRTDDGCKCVVGHIIPDDKYDPKMEGKNSTLIIDMYDIFPSTTEEIYQFLSDLQDCHDSAVREHEINEQMLDNFHNNMVRLAARYNLVMPK